jgi:hypothetical protein
MSTSMHNRGASSTAPHLHGSENGYINHGCRCGACREAHRLAIAGLRASYRERAAAGDPAVPHGSRGGYDNWLCRCGPCRRAKQQSRAGSGAVAGGAR